MIFEDKIYQFQRSDFNSFFYFIKENFSNKYIFTHKKFLEWQYGTTPEFIKNFDKKKILSIILLKENSRVLGYLGIIPLRYKIFNYVKKVNVYANLFIDPKLRQLGLGTILIKRGMEGVDAALISSYKPSTFSIYKKLGDWREMGNFFRYSIIFNSYAVNKLLNKEIPEIELNKWKFRIIPISKSYLDFEYVKFFSGDFNKFWNNIYNKYKITIERNKDYLTWRYINHPHFKYFILTARRKEDLVGYLIYRLEKTKNFKIARIIDFISKDEFEIDLLNKFILSVIKKGADMADFMFSGNYYHNSLKKVGFFEANKTPLEFFPILFNPVSYKKTFINFMVWTKNKNINKNEFYNPLNWYLTKGDGDQDRPNPH